MRPAAAKSDFGLTPSGRLNGILGRVFASESHLLERFDLPFGVSIVALAGKPQCKAPADGR